MLRLRKVSQSYLTFFNNRLSGFVQGVNRFTALADDSDRVPNLQGKSYATFKLSHSEWEKMELMRDVLRVILFYQMFKPVLIICFMQEPADAQQSFSSNTQSTVSRTLPVLECLRDTWESMAATEKYESVAPSISAGLANIHKWYGKTDDTDVYFVNLGKLSFNTFLTKSLTCHNKCLIPI